MPRKTKAEDRQEFAARQRRADPVLTEKNYKVDLLNYTNYHNKNTDYKVIRKWAISYAESLNKKFGSVVNKASDYELRTIGVLSHALMRGDYVSPEHKERLTTDVSDIVQKYQEQKEQKAEVVATAPVQDKNELLYTKHKAEVDAALDAFITKDEQFSMKGYVASNNVSGPIARRIGQAFLGLSKELREAIDGTDDQLKEAYSHLGKVKLKRFYALILQIMADCEQQVVAAKAPRKPRVKKEKPAAVLVAKFKYLKDFPEMGLKSEDPKNIVGSSQIWLYDTEKRKAFVYTAEKGKTLSVKGTTILNWDVTASNCKTLRKPEAFVKGNLAKRAIAQNYESLTTKPQSVNGRTNEKMILLKVF